MRAELKQLHQRLGSTMVYVTHDQVEALTLGDRVAVLNEGVLQQVATPTEIYRRPVNRFVGTFIGSPAMNVLPLENVDGVFHAGPFVLGSANLDARQLELGIRPEQVLVSMDGSAEGAPAEVQVVEEAGNETFLHLDAAGHTIVVRAGPDIRPPVRHDGPHPPGAGPPLPLRRRDRRGRLPLMPDFLKSERFGSWAMLAPYLLGLAALILVPGVITFAFALSDWDLITSPRWIGLDNFTELIDDEIFRKALRNSLVYIAFAVPLRILGAMFLALLLHKRYRGVGTYRTSAYLPTIIPDMAYALLFLWLFNPLYGPVNVFLSWIGLTPQLWLTDPNAAQAAVIIMSLFIIGEGFIVLLATRMSIPPELYELSAVENAKPLYVFWRLTLPVMAPTLLLLTFRDTIFSLQANFVPALIVTEGGPPPYSTTYLPLFVYREAFEYFRYGYAAAATVTMFVVTLLIVLIQWRIIRRWRHAFVV